MFDRRYSIKLHIIVIKLPAEIIPFFINNNLTYFALDCCYCDESVLGNECGCSIIYPGREMYSYRVPALYNSAEQCTFGNSILDFC